MPHRMTRLALAAAAGAALSAAPAVATEGPAGGPALPNALAPVTIQPTGTDADVRRPRVTQARVKPRRIHEGRRSRMRIALATPGRVRIVTQRIVRGHHVRVSVRTVAAPRLVLALRTSARLRAGRYRITVVAFDAAGNRSAAVRRSLTVVRR